PYLHTTPPAPPHIVTLSLHDALPISHDAHTDGLEHGLGAVASIEFLINRRQVVLDRFDADVQLLGHLGGGEAVGDELEDLFLPLDRKSTRLNSSHEWISYAVFCLKKK